jgi:hydrogenase 3 maturation protease
MLLLEILVGKVVFAGVGNALLGDDSVGPYIAENVGGIDTGTVPENYIGKIAKMNPDHVVLFDALDFGGKAGEMRIIRADDSTGLMLSTHALPLSKFASMLAPAKVFLVGIQPKGIALGEGMSEEVKNSAQHIISQVNYWRASR